jgi:hypothetical protein
MGVAVKVSEGQEGRQHETELQNDQQAHEVGLEAMKLGHQQEMQDLTESYSNEENEL